MEEKDKLTCEQNQTISHAIADLVRCGIDNERIKKAKDFMIAEFIELNKQTYSASVRRMI